MWIASLPAGQRNTRNLRGSVFDMFNLINAENYISVLLYMNDKKNNRYDDLYKKYAFKGRFYDHQQEGYRKRSWLRPDY